MAFSVLLAGGVGWGFDLCDLRELRQRTRERLSRPGAPGSDEDEKALQQMMDDVLKRFGLDKGLYDDAELNANADANAEGKAVDEKEKKN